MATRLQRLGERMVQFKWWVVCGWALLLAVLAIVMIQVGPKTDSSLSIPGTEAQKTLDRFIELFPDAGAQSAKVVIETPQGKNIQQYRERITALTDAIAKVDNVTRAVSPFALASAISSDGTIGYITVQLKGEQGVVSSDTISKVDALIETARKESGLTIAAGGDLVVKEIGEILGVGEVAGVIIALVVLLLTLGSLIAAGMPIITAIIAVGISMTGLFSLSHVVSLTSTAPVLAVMLGLAVGIDYSLFIVNRYRTYVKEGYELKEAAGRSIATAGNAVIFAASTVVIALVSLSVVNIPFMTVMGLAAAATVAVAALVAITLIPALLGIFGLYIFGPTSRKAIRELESTHEIHHVQVSHSTIWYHWGEFILKHRKVILGSALAVIVALSLPVAKLQLGLPTDETAAKTSSRREAYDLLVKGFGAGYNGPLLVIAEGLKPVSAEEKNSVRQQIIQQYQQQLIAQGGAISQPMTPEAQATAAATLEKSVETYSQYYHLQQVAKALEGVEGVAQAQAVLTADNGTRGVIQVIPKSGPSNVATKDLVTYLRASDNQNNITGDDAITLAVTGTTAIQIDINAKLAAALPVYLGVVVGLSLLILMLAFRSILIPIKATLGFLLSVFAMFGALVAVFQWGWFGITDAPGPIVSFIPIIAIGILFGLAMDYEFFLVSGMQEAYHETKNARKAVLQGFAIGSRVVVAAGLIMVAVFAGFIGNHDETIQSMGFALSLGILVDAFIVRMTIVPIVMSYLDRSAWWLPAWLDKLLPRVSIEGRD